MAEITSIFISSVFKVIKLMSLECSRDELSLFLTECWLKLFELCLNRSSRFILDSHFFYSLKCLMAVLLETLFEYWRNIVQ